MGDSVAIPHARVDAANWPADVLAHLKYRIAIEGPLVDLVFLLLVPTNPRGRAAQRIGMHAARKLRDADVLVKARRAGTATL